MLIPKSEAAVTVDAGMAGCSILGKDTCGRRCACTPRSGLAYQFVQSEARINIDLLFRQFTRRLSRKASTSVSSLFSSLPYWRLVRCSSKITQRLQARTPPPEDVGTPNPPMGPPGSAASALSGTAAAVAAVASGLPPALASALDTLPPLPPLPPLASLGPPPHGSPAVPGGLGACSTDSRCVGCGFEAADDNALLVHSYQCAVLRRTVRGGWSQQSEMRALGTHKCRFCDYRDYAEYNVKKHEQRSHFGLR
ncbi:hypothetical protein BIW11_04147 [Tropilaelaps mercedesae]|uniref:Uncharacterized protein n=1 Tax=Tropilaelaps mercedesae TaxID=418985 RepID=A0A1V9XAR6_9ACAR|nr:hypothetical protein BIW11_04147 [Tropilaelaps mercedesae]